MTPCPQARRNLDEAARSIPDLAVMAVIYPQLAAEGARLVAEILERNGK